jgi:hypothetical protein
MPVPMPADVNVKARHVDIDLRADRGSSPNRGNASKPQHFYNSIPHGTILSTFHQ